MNASTALPRWADLVLLPLVCLATALLAAGAVVAAVGQDPVDVLLALLRGAFGSLRGLSYSLYYTTTFIFTGLSVAVALHGGLFNIGAEGQATLGGLVGMNEVAGVSGKLVLEFVGGAGFTGIAVALMGRNHPLGIVLAALLFGGLFQGGTEVAFDVPGFTHDMVVLLQGLIVLFSGAMTQVVAAPLGWLLRLPGRLRHG